MKRILPFIIIIFFSFSCSIKRKVTTKIEQDKITNTEKNIEVETIDIRAPRSNVTIFGQIKYNYDGKFEPQRRTIVVPETKQTLEYEISEYGELSIKSISPADTITKTVTKINEKTNIDENTVIKDKEDFEANFSLGEFLTNFLNGIIPGLGDLVSSIFDIIGGIVTGVGFIILLVVVFIIIIIRKIFNRKETI